MATGNRLDPNPFREFIILAVIYGSFDLVVFFYFDGLIRYLFGIVALIHFYEAVRLDALARKIQRLRDGDAE